MSMLNRRLQILIDEDRYRQLSAKASETGVSVATVVRDAIDSLIRPDLARKRRAAERILDAEPMDVPDDPADLKREIRDYRAGRDE
jgi:hypothetical protein